MGGRDGLRSFVALGTVREGAPYHMEMTPDFRPWRRDVDWTDARAAPITPLLPRMAWSRDGAWGAKLRFGLVRISAEDMAVIEEAMGVE